MKIVRAMKERARLEGEIKDIKHRMKKYLNVIEGNTFPEDYTDLWEFLCHRTNKLSRLKLGVMKANQDGGMFKYILQLGELKSYITFLKELEVRNGKQEKDYSENIILYISQLNERDRLASIHATQLEINRITDLLDDFNSKTDIGEIEEVALTLPMIES
jgi:hypothetical protein